VNKSERGKKGSTTHEQHGRPRRYKTSKKKEKHPGDPGSQFTTLEARGGNHRGTETAYAIPHPFHTVDREEKRKKNRGPVGQGGKKNRSPKTTQGFPNKSEEGKEREPASLSLSYEGQGKRKGRTCSEGRTVYLHGVSE